jgi:hypothetical protein
LYADNPCDQSFSGCLGQDDPVCASAPRDTYLTVVGRRTAGSGAHCSFRRHEFAPNYDYGFSTGRPSYVGYWNWTDRDGNAADPIAGPKLTNECAGAFDVVVTLRNEYQDKTLVSGSNIYRQSRSFAVRRPGRLTANAGAPAAVGTQATISGRLTRADWDKAGNPQVPTPESGCSCSERHRSTASSPT